VVETGGLENRCTGNRTGGSNPSPSAIPTMSMHVTIRPATLDDCEPIARLSEQLGYPTTREQTQQRLQGIITHNRDHIVYVAVSHDTVIGWIHALVHPSLLTDTAAEIAGLVVDEQHRSQGIGEILMAHAEQWARKHGCHSVRLRSNVKRDRAHAFYQRLGYTLWKSSHAFRKDLV
jgi:GNAT superfamily N-acetyltransferase